jgi:uncharacterized protein YgiM (DUF1202 family)
MYWRIGATGALLVALLATTLLGGGPSEVAAAADFSSGDRVIVDTDALNVRSGPSLSDEAFFVAENGLVATVLDGPVAADDYTWFEVSFDAGPEGWVAGEYLSLVDSTAGIPIGTRVVVDTDALNVRSAAGLGNEVVNVLPQGYAAFIGSDPVAADGYTWYRVDAMGESLGWVAGEYLAVEGHDGGFAVGARVSVDTDALNVRSDAGLGAEVVNELPFGYVAFISSEPVAADGYTWYQVDAMGVTLGWVAGEYLIAD